MSGTQGQDDSADVVDDQGNILRRPGVTVIHAGDLMAAVKAKRGQRGGGRPPVDSKTRARIRRLAREGLSQSEIARRCEVSRSTVAKVCAEAKPPISFDRSHTAAAVQAHTVDLKARRQALASRVLGDAISQLDKLTQPHEITHWDKDGLLHRGELDGPTSGDVKNYATAAAILIDKHLVLVRHDSDGGELSGLDAFLSHLMPGRASEPVE